MYLKKSIFIATLSLLSLNFFSESNSEYKVVRVVDGDTIYVSSDLDFLKIRLSDIDTPELNQAYGNEAKRYLSNLIYNKKVSIRISSTDRYGRHIGRIFLNDVDINSLLVEKGLAWVYRKYTKDQSLIALESSARTKKLGLWANSKAVEPWIWRRLNR